MLLTPKDLSFVGYTYKNFEAVKGLHNSCGMGNSFYSSIICSDLFPSSLYFFFKKYVCECHYIKHDMLLFLLVVTFSYVLVNYLANSLWLFDAFILQTRRKLLKYWLIQPDFTAGSFIICLMPEIIIQVTNPQKDDMSFPLDIICPQNLANMFSLERAL